MKLFQRLLVAPAALGLLAPISANATEVNFDGISNYSDEDIEINSNSFRNHSTTESLLAGGEGLTDSHDHGSDSFSSTTSASFGADFLIGSEDGVDGNEAVTAGYSFGMKLNTSFTGEDKLQVKFDAGNADDGNLDEFDKHDKGDTLIVDGISYKFPVGDSGTAFVGDSVDGSSLYNTACVYGGPSKTLSDCGVGTSGLAKGAGIAAGASYDIGEGFTLGFAYTGDGTTEGLMSKEGMDAYGSQISYAADSYGVSANYAYTDTSATEETVYLGLNGYWTPSEAGAVPSISVGYETGKVSNETPTNRDTFQYFIGAQWDEVGPGTLGAAIGSNGAIAEDSASLSMYEVFYSYPVNDGMKITPLIYVKENTGADDNTGIMVKTSFKF